MISYFSHFLFHIDFDFWPTFQFSVHGRLKLFKFFFTENDIRPNLLTFNWVIEQGDAPTCLHPHLHLHSPPSQFIPRSQVIPPYQFIPPLFYPPPLSPQFIAPPVVYLFRARLLNVGEGLKTWEGG